jgi:hypothetical protein
MHCWDKPSSMLQKLHSKQRLVHATSACPLSSLLGHAAGAWGHTSLGGEPLVWHAMFRGLMQR